MKIPQSAYPVNEKSFFFSITGNLPREVGTWKRPRSSQSALQGHASLRTRFTPLDQVHISPKRLPCIFFKAKENQTKAEAFPLCVPEIEEQNGRVLVIKHKSSRRTAYAQLIVTTRLLYNLHDRVEQLSRMQRIYPHAW